MFQQASDMLLDKTTKLPASQYQILSVMILEAEGNYII